MIYSSADILRALGSDVIIRQAARLSIVDGKPGYEADEYVYIYIDKYPTIDGFEATWKVWIVDATGGESLDLVLSAISALLPNFDPANGYYTVTDLASDKTVVKTEVEKQLEQTQAERVQLKREFSGVSQSLQAQAAALKDGRDGKDGKDGKDGRDGVDGKDGKDLVATDASIFDLTDVDTGIQLLPGQVLTWNGTEWTNLYVRQSTTYIGGGGNGSGNGSGGNGQINSDTITSDTPPTTRENGKGPLQDGDTWWKSDDGAFFVYYVDGDNGQWVEVESGGGGSSDVQVLDDLNDVTTDGVQNGQFLQYNSASGEWEPVTIAPGSGIEEAPQDGNYYVRQSGQWINLENALTALGITGGDLIDGGDFDGLGSNDTINGGDFTVGEGGDSSVVFDGGDITTGSSSATDSSTPNGGDFTKSAF